MRDLKRLKARKFANDTMDVVIMVIESNRSAMARVLQSESPRLILLLPDLAGIHHSSGVASDV